MDEGRKVAAEMAAGLWGDEGIRLRLTEVEVTTDIADDPDMDPPVIERSSGVRPGDDWTGYHYPNGVTVWR